VRVRRRARFWKDSKCINAGSSLKIAERLDWVGTLEGVEGPLLSTCYPKVIARQPERQDKDGSDAKRTGRDEMREKNKRMVGVRNDISSELKIQFMVAHIKITLEVLGYVVAMAIGIFKSPTEIAVSHDRAYALLLGRDWALTQRDQVSQFGWRGICTCNYKHSFRPSN
jgi:hypothetical protein